MRRVDIINEDPEDDGVRLAEREHAEGRYIHAVEAMNAIAARDALLREYISTCDECDDDGEQCPLCQRARKMLEGE